jgi:hypothetical protein
MLAMKAPISDTTFLYSANYWTTTNTLNTSSNNRDTTAAKFDTFNYFHTTDCMAIFVDSSVNGGDLPASLGTGWVWVENNAFGVSVPLSRWFSSGIQLAKLSNGVVYGGTNPIPINSTKFNSTIFSYQTGFQWYGFNYTSGTYNTAVNNMRWGFAWNNEADQNSNDTRGGIGWGTYSAGSDGGAPAGSRRFEWWVR